ncbi:hypothetical protein B0H63DRAFT_456129 [Podospora didyma]|uniref:Uncharacterized protein n=1 Tax=Podospora didyma TaxID=330526 RepID=A0AAE0JXZ9_9PEZI|nr:hypothetical protein B0H63DRAFT_456129 [Podospora didyma]
MEAFRRARSLQSGVLNSSFVALSKSSSWESCLAASSSAAILYLLLHMPPRSVPQLFGGVTGSINPCIVIGQLLGIFWVPESPWWLAQEDRMEEAQIALRQLASERVDTQRRLNFIVKTIEGERELQMCTGSTFGACFQGVNLRRTEISVGIYCIQVLSDSS